MRKAFNFYQSHWEQIKLLNDKQKLELFNAICSVQFLEVNIDDISFKDQISTLVWTGIKHSLSTSISGYLTKQKSLNKVVEAPLTKGGIEAPTIAPYQQEKEKEEEKEEEKGKESGSRLENLPMSQKEKLFAYTKKYCNDNNIDLIEIEKFNDYWKGVSGSKGIKKDWKATFRNWCRNDWVKKTENHTSSWDQAIKETING